LFLAATTGIFWQRGDETGKHGLSGEI